MPTPIYLAVDKYYGEITQVYTPGDTSIYVDIVPDNVPTILVAAKGTSNETVFTCTNKTANAVTGVARLKGANVELLAQTPITCLNNEEFINQYRSYLGISWQGTYDALTTYEIQDGVIYNGSGYQAIAQTTGNLPTDTNYWQLVMEKGDTGATIESAAFVVNDLVFTKDDASTVTLVDAKIDLKGDTGDTGASITSAAFVGNDLIFTKDDTNTVTLLNALIDLKGDTGEQGIQGEQGIAGGTDPASLTDGTYIEDTTNTNNYAGNTTEAIIAYEAGLIVNLKVTNANTDVATLNVNSLGAKSIKKNVSDAIEADDIKAGQIVPLIYDGTNFQIVGGGGGTGGSGDFLVTQVFS